MNRPLALLLASGLALAALGTGCTSLQVRRDWDRTVDFSRYKTFELRVGTPARKEKVDARIRTAIAEGLGRHGLAEVTKDADLLVYTHVAIGQQVTIDNTLYGVVQWNVWGFWVEPGRSAPDLVPTGSIAVDLIDARDKKLVWRGKAVDDPEAYGGSRGDTLLRKMADRLFDGFPPPPGSKAE